MLRKHTDNADADNFDNSDNVDLMDDVMGKTFVVLNSKKIKVYNSFGTLNVRFYLAKRFVPANILENKVNTYQKLNTIN